jgi:hypothetical protein
VWIIAASALQLMAPVAALAAPVLGFIEDFPGPGIGAWSGGTPVFNNPGAGGVLGGGDGYLYVQTTFASNWGIRCRQCPEYTGSWSAAGITQVRLWLNDVLTPEPFEIHAAIGNDNNLWQYDIGFAPPGGRWAPFVVDLTNGADFTQLIGTQPFSEALDTVNVLLIRHDKAPYLPNPNPPDAIAGDAGIDRILLTNGTVGIEPPPPGARRPPRLAAPYPNPAHGAVTFGLENPEGGALQLEILDVLGRVVRREAWPAGRSGAQTWRWDRLGDDGRRVPPGMYRVRARGEAGAMSRPFVVVD